MTWPTLPHMIYCLAAMAKPQLSENKRHMNFQITRQLWPNVSHERLSPERIFVEVRKRPNYVVREKFL